MLNLANLDDRTRHFMLLELRDDMGRGNLYLSPRLTNRGIADWPALLSEAVEHGNDTTLAAQLRVSGQLRLTEPRRKPKGGVTFADVPVTAAETLSEGEFNRFYIRGLCRRAIEDGISELIIYRAKAVDAPRPESEARIGSRIDARKLLDDLRAKVGVDPALGVPAGPNSGLSVRLH